MNEITNIGKEWAGNAARKDSGEVGFQPTKHDEANDGTANSTMGIPVHRFEDSGSGYDQTQYDDNIKDGDLLVVESEKVFGFLNEAWPIAVTTECGNFHRLKVDKESFLADHPQYFDVWAEAVKMAKDAE